MVDPSLLWMLTATGRRFYPAAPAAADVDILDIAHGLSLLCRFGGHIRTFYSVAEHSVRVAAALGAAGHDAGVMFGGLMHDAAEAYLGDVIWPVKQLLPDYRALERGVEAAIAARFGLTGVAAGEIKRFDLRMLSTEKRDLTCAAAAGAGHDASKEAAAHDERWHSDDFAPLPDRIEPWSPVFARAAFLTLFDDLCRPEDMTPPDSYVPVRGMYQRGGPLRPERQP